MSAVELCLIGDVIVDVSMTNPVKMRLGGIFHAARTCWALGIGFRILYLAPDYLTKDIENYAQALGVISVERIGVVEGCPNVVVIQEPTEAGSQGYEYLLRDSYSCRFVDDLSERIPASCSDLMVFPGGYDLLHLLASCSGKGDLAVDIANWSGSISELGGFNIATIISSTSSSLFLDGYQADVELFKGACLSVADTLVFKENRGGSRIFSVGELAEIGSQLRPIVHSVGVGDSYNAAYISRRRLSYGPLSAGNFSSWIAAEYATTTYPDDFKQAVCAVKGISDEIMERQQGVSMPWERRSAFNVYVAAPDFDYNDRSLIDRVDQALRYHNFRPRLPIRENGQAQAGDSYAQRSVLFHRDLKLFDECQILVAILMNSDPGTLVEIGLAVGMGMPTVVYDPYGLASNVMLAHLPDAVCPTLDEVISAVFRLTEKLGK